MDFWARSGRFKEMDKANDKIKTEGTATATVAAAVSGGVDSAVSAGMLKNGGFEVVGVFARLSGNKTEDEKQARAVCKKLEIPFHVVDLRAEFKKRIIDKFTANTEKGLTPNPCVFCNEEIKFGLLMEAALKSGADYFATGHYCQNKIDKSGIYHLSKGADKKKDQSYFLWRLKQKQLGKIIFPLGVFKKNEVKELAKIWQLPVKNNSESQDVCFISGQPADFFKKHLGGNPGDIVDADAKKIIGRHRGLWFYTVGQRKGIGLPGGPFYVIGKNLAKNRLLVSKKMPAASSVKLSNINWIAGAVPDLPRKINIKIRYRAKEAAAVLDKIGKDYVLRFAKPQFAPTPGQSAVFYVRGELIGGGIIK